MKIKYIKYVLVSCLVSITSMAFTQTEAFPYQTIVTDGEGLPIKDVATEVQVDLIQGTATGTVVYTETHSATTGLNGELYLEIGNGVASGTAFDEVDWSQPHFIELSYQPNGFMAFVPMGKVQLLSVPYALFALKVTCEEGCPGEDGPAGEDGFPGPAGPQGPQGFQGAQGPAGTDGVNGLPGKSGLEALSLSVTVPAMPDSGDFYLDDGTNRADGKPGLRYWDGTNWINL